MSCEGADFAATSTWHHCSKKVTQEAAVCQEAGKVFSTISTRAFTRASITSIATTRAASTSTSMSSEFQERMGHVCLWKPPMLCTFLSQQPKVSSFER